MKNINIGLFIMLVLSIVLNLILLGSNEVEVEVSDNSYQVQLANKAIVKVNEIYGREFKSGDKVCIENISFGDWYIDNDGFMKDTLEVIPLDSTILFTEYRIGIVQ